MTFCWKVQYIEMDEEMVNYLGSRRNQLSVGEDRDNIRYWGHSELWAVSYSRSFG
jgi:hypothetical protein